MPCLSFPHLTWWIEALQCGRDVRLYTGRPYRNTGYCNRYRISTANGPLLLSIPVKGGRRNSAPLSETRIDYTHAWQRQHWRTLFSAYGRAPFFEHYGPELESLIRSRHECLSSFNLAAIAWLRKSIWPELRFTTIETIPAEAGDLYWQEAASAIQPYHQVFEARHGFLPDLSAIDLLMNEGPYAAAHLLQP